MYIDDFEKDKREFFSKRCEKILRNFYQEKKSFGIFERLLKKLGKDEKDLLFLYSEEMNKEYSEVEEKLYSSGFFDGINFILQQFR